MKNHYITLGIPSHATQDEIKKAFRALAHQYHPDKATGNTEKFKEINFAYSEINTPEKQRNYNARMGIGQSTPVYNPNSMYEWRTGTGATTNSRMTRMTMEEILKQKMEDQEAQLHNLRNMFRGHTQAEMHKIYYYDHRTGQWKYGNPPH